MIAKNRLVCTPFPPRFCWRWRELLVDLGLERVAGFGVGDLADLADR